MFAFGAEQVTLHYSPEAYGNFTLLNAAEYVDGGTATERGIRCKLELDEPPTPFLHAGTLVTLPEHCTTAQALARRNGEPYDEWRPPFFQVLVDATSLNVDLANVELDNFRRADLLAALTDQQRTESEQESEAAAKKQAQQQRRRWPRLSQLAGLALEARLGRAGAVFDLVSLLKALRLQKNAPEISPDATTSMTKSSKALSALSLSSKARDTLDDEINMLPGTIIAALTQIGEELMQAEPGSPRQVELLRAACEVLLPRLRLDLPVGGVPEVTSAEISPGGEAAQV